jgi:UDP-glucose 4-epimerase
MKILVTGGAGFIGGHLTQNLLNLGHKVYVIDNESATSSETFNWFEKANNNKIDILDYEKVEDVFKEGIDYVFHLAAETKIEPSIQNPEKCFNVNINGTLNLLNLCRKYKIKRFIFASTSAIYGMNLAPHHELQTPDILNPYSSSKLCGETLCKTYTNIYELETVCFRFFNVYGEKMPNKGFYAPVIAAFRKQIQDNKELNITGDGEQRRDFIYVGDIVDAMIKAAFSDNKKIIGNVYNLGCGKNYSINEVAKIFNHPFFYSEKRIAYYP